ncbi:MAG: MFS transporter [Acidobacteriaceae bacterium]|nr:MFS transporter [Acidobacteriaceae bacterium]
MDLELPLPVVEASARDRISSYLAGMAGWTLDAFDYFLVVFSLTAIGTTFHKSDATVAGALFATMVLRPVGALLFGTMADRYGRRPALIVNLVLFSVVTMATALAPTFLSFLIIRAIFGVVMGGQWGIGTSLAMEKVPPRLRGFLSGVLQQGYALGNLLAAIATYFLAAHYSWRLLFMIAAVPALPIAYLCYAYVEESDVWRSTRHNTWADMGKAFYHHKWLLVYITLFMTAISMTSHGSQDMYPAFLQRQWGVGVQMRSMLTGITTLGALVGGVCVGYLSDRIGRRKAMTLAIGGALLAIPLWAFAPSLPLLVLGGFLMQFMVQGSFGVVPAHLAEMTPNSLRGSLPGLGYQFGILLAASIPPLEASLARTYGYPHVMAGVMAVVLCTAGVMTMLGKERHAVDFNQVA